MKKIALFSIVIFLALLIGCDNSSEQKAATAEKVAAVDSVQSKQEKEIKSSEQLKQIILTLGSWRKDDVEQVNYILSKFNEQYPHIVVKFDPTLQSEYNDVIETQLETGTAPDLFYLRSFSHSKKLYDDGYLVDLTDLSGLKENFSLNMLDAWTNDAGEIYGVPLMAVSHGIYYNKSFFEKEGLAVPDTWEQLLLVAEKIKEMGIVPFGNATGEAWTINGLIYQNVIPSIIGGKKGRQAYYDGERCFNDADMVATFQAVKDVALYVSENQRLLKYADSLQLFIQGKTPMLFDGSWNIPFFESQYADFEWSVFPIPPPQGKDCHVVFHPDAGIGLNQSSPYIKEAKLFLEWLTTSEFATLFVEQLPGFFPMHNGVAGSANKHAATFLGFNKQCEVDIRFAWGKIREGTPDSYRLSIQTSIDVMNNEITPQEAADQLQEGLSKWYEPAANCQK